MFEKSSSIIKDPSKFDYDYVPKNLVNREEQMHDMEVLFRPLVEYNRACNAFLMGPVGTGKTVTAKRFCQDMKDYCSDKGMALDIIYVNCRNNNSESGVIFNLIRYFDKGYPERGFSVENMARTLKNHLVKNKKPIVVILDEVDVLLKKSTVDILYQITRLSDDANKPAPVSLILISQQSIYGMMDEASASTFKRTTMVRFDRYSWDELRQIAKERAEEALLPGRVSEDVLDQIADSSEEFGDARMAIEILERAANLAEEDSAGEVTVENIRAAKAGIYSVVSESKIETLDLNKKLTLLAIARAMKQNVMITISAAEKTYAIVCEEYEVPARKHTQFWGYVQDLEKVGLVKTRVSSSGKGGRTTTVSLPDIPSKVLAVKVADMLDSELSGREDDDEM
ncbi:MAG: AAA family ATPase [Candidatus Methanomethylophilaceae archaeon]|nr:AAA family ATPase [Candidatus Methanomethylophilaceae archaeon]